jgi:hypothetical protein
MALKLQLEEVFKGSIGEIITFSFADKEVKYKITYIETLTRTNGQSSDGYSTLSLTKI